MILKNKHIFILSLAKFDDEIESTSFTMAKHLAVDNCVYYIENPFTLKGFLQRKNVEKMKRRKKYFSPGSNGLIDTLVPNLKILVTPPLLPINWIPEGSVYRAVLKINEQIIQRRILQVIKKYRIKDYIFINSFNFYYPGVGKRLAPSIHVYHCVDPLVFSVDRKHGMASEAQIVKDADLIICTSKKLHDEKRQINEHTFFIPNAADIRHSSKALHPGVPVHSCLKDIKLPIVGYFGNIERRLDYNLLSTLTAMNEDLSFVFTGPLSRDSVPAWFYNRPNIHLTGPVPYDQMPQVLRGFDIAAIPFRKDEYSATIFPLKLFEYLGSGKPVVATDFNSDLADFTGTTVAYCKDAVSFSKAIRDSLYNDSEQLKQKRLDVAKQNTWEKRTDEFSELINKYILRKQKRVHELWNSQQ